MSVLPPNAIGNDGLLRFIDEMNEIRARSGNRFRYRPFMKDKQRNLLGMEEHYAIERPARATTPSPRFFTAPATPYGYKD